VAQSSAPPGGLTPLRLPTFLKYGVLNEVQQVLLVDRYSAQSGLTTTTDLAGKKLERYKDTRRYIGALNILREACTDPAKLAACSVTHGLALYRQLLKSKCYLDYTSIMEEAVALLRDNAAVRGRVAARVRRVIVDEYQDVTPLQQRVLTAWLGDRDRPWLRDLLDEALAKAKKYGMKNGNVAVPEELKAEMAKLANGLLGAVTEGPAREKLAGQLKPFLGDASPESKVLSREAAPEPPKDTVPPANPESPAAPPAKKDIFDTKDAGNPYAAHNLARAKDGVTSIRSAWPGRT
jgi:hypothetical protein